MEIKKFFEYLKSNVENLYLRFYKVFNLNTYDYYNLIQRLIKDVVNDSFYANLLKNYKVEELFSDDSLIRIKNYLENIEIKGEDVFKVLVTIPEILFFYDDLNGIFPIFRNNNFKGITLVTEDDFRAYSYSPVFYNNSNLNVILEGDVINNYSYLVRSMIESLERSDVKNVLAKENRIITGSLRQKFLILEKDTSKKNYYFKKIK